MVSRVMRRRLSGAAEYERRYGYSRAVIDDPFIFISGTTGLDYATLNVEGDVAQQTRRAWENIAAVLAQEDCCPSDIVRVSCIAVDRSEIDTILRISQGFLIDRSSRRDTESGRSNLPAMSAFSVRQFFNPAMRVAVEATVMWSGHHMRG
jgi:enamine deaminase RidA (YjgF/YER057c/UK114 family)